ncbi:MAG: CoA pyrophosphatase [Clostridia bacterium]
MKCDYLTMELEVVRIPSGAFMTLSRTLQLISDQHPLPGDQARLIMLPEYRRNLTTGSTQDQESEGLSWREAAVLILLFADQGQTRFPLILRVDGPGVHAGQVSLPGGAREYGESLEACAIRETAEETGVQADTVQIIRELSPLQVPPSRFTVYPFVGMASQRPAFRPSPSEVAAIMTSSVDELLDPASRYQEMLNIRGKDWLVPCYRLAGHRVWGATAMILAELSALLDQG